ncbi:MAG TPA: hypothetical protein VK983_05455 [Candidatus Limnocylindrales bacterium]|nr:hypothetical protein [Candidatus Limnocylindrales bacterium]
MSHISKLSRSKRQPHATTKHRVINHRPGRHHAVKRAIRDKRTFVQRMLLHPTAAFGALLFGIFLAALTYQVAAVDYSVRAVVGAQPLSIGAIITNPAGDTSLSSKQLTVSGTCPDEAYIKLFRNGAFSGVVICEAGAFRILTDLNAGKNILQAQAYNITDAAGPVTPAIVAAYAPPAGSVEAATGQLPPYVLTSEYRFNRTKITETFSWKLERQGSTGPYSTTIDWGDGSKPERIVTNGLELTIQHQYKERGYYPVRVADSDSSRRTASLQLVALIREPSDPAISGSILGPDDAAPTGGQRFGWLSYAWPTYAVILIMLASFWLGERREYLKLMKASVKPKRLRHS